ncbi:hypothetical protein [Spiroplasma turonicum]|uniref:hypothetical protein n=1 Tax=Spiroplasma turonicum TaxID=216946 RepID=UPI0009466459|nr:hypothetical protein [Spiroplasma turonicum]
MFKLFISRVHLNALKEEFCSIYNSLDGAIKPLYIYNLRKVSNKVSSLINFYSKYKKWMKKEENNFVIKRFILPKTNNFLIQDLVYPQVTPDDFKMVNSINNVFVEEKSALLGIFKNDKSTYVTFIYDKKDEKITSYFNQYWEIIENKEKNIEFFVTNCSLILCDNLLISSDYFNKFNEEEKTFYSALNKFRFENPSMGQEYLKMKFFAGFIKGNNFFK